MEINGLPLHPLVVHAAVVFGPLAALSALAYVGLPKHRDKLRWVTLVVVLIGFVSIWAAYLTGDNFFGTSRFDNFSGEALEKIEHHEDLANVLRWVTTGFALVTVVAVWQHDRQGAARYALGGLVVVLGIATLVYTVLTGDAGAKAVWG
jgi:O-antigen/teichoic acid export membrane protein